MGEPEETIKSDPMHDDDPQPVDPFKDDAPIACGIDVKEECEVCS